MMFLVTNQLYHSMPWSGMLCVVYGIIDVKSRGSFDVKFQGHGMVILPGLRPASVDAARNKQLDYNDCSHRPSPAILRYQDLLPSFLQCTVEAGTQAHHPRLSQRGRLANSKDGVESESYPILCICIST